MMQPPTTPTTTAAIRFTETGQTHLQPISIPTVAEQAKWAQIEGVNPVGSLMPREAFENLSFDAEWLSVIQQRIISSVPAEGYSAAGNTAWLKQEVARAALDFFKSTSTSLPGEPYLYSSQAGDLVAEFSAPRGRMTCLISPNFVLVFAVAGDEVVERKLFPNQESAGKLRSEIKAVTNMLT